MSLLAVVAKDLQRADAWPCVCVCGIRTKLLLSLRPNSRVRPLELLNLSGRSVTQLDEIPRRKFVGQKDAGSLDYFSTSRLVLERETDHSCFGRSREGITTDRGRWRVMVANAADRPKERLLQVVRTPISFMVVDSS